MESGVDFLGEDEEDVGEGGRGGIWRRGEKGRDMVDMEFSRRGMARGRR